MKIETHFFSRLRDVVGGQQFTLELPAGSTISDLLARLYADHPKLGGWDRSLLLAVELDFVERTQVLREGDRVSIMPPVQGG